MRSLRRVIHEQGNARIIAATGASQFEFLDALTGASDIEWSRIRGFSSRRIRRPSCYPTRQVFAKYLFERLIHKTGITRYHLLDGDGDPQSSIREIGSKLNRNQWTLLLQGLEKMHTWPLTIRPRILKLRNRISSSNSIMRVASSK